MACSGIGFMAPAHERQKVFFQGERCFERRPKGNAMRALFILGVIALGLAGCAGDSALTPTDTVLASSTTVDGAISRWKASPGHNSNLLMPQARKIGLARADANNRYGRYWALVLGQ
jgi:hypothetical protein